MENRQFRSRLKNNLAFLVAVPAVVWQVLFLYVPFFFVISASLFVRWKEFDLSAFTLANYAAVINYTHFAIIGRSLYIALIVSCICLLIGYPVAYYFAIRLRKFKNMFLFFLTLPFWTSFIVQAYAWFFVLEREGLLNKVLLTLHIISEPLPILYTAASVVAVMVYCYLPFMILPIYSTLEKFDTRLIEASLDLGASPRTTFFKITLPITMSGVRNGFFLVFIPVFGEYAIPAILGGGKKLYAGSLISLYFLEARNPALGAAFTILSSLVLLLCVYVMYRILAGPKLLQQEK